MPKFFVPTNQIEKDKIVIQNDDVNHIKNVLRAKVDDKIDICDYNTSKNYVCKIEEIEDKVIRCKIIEEIDSNVESEVKVSIFQGIPKADKMELVIQKSVELGAYDITPIEMKRCIVRIKENDKEKKITRWQKISEVASKQCGRNYIPKINAIGKIYTIIEQIKEYDVVLVAYEEEKENTLKDEIKNLRENLKDYCLSNENKIKIAVLIGPEGGIDKEEVNALEKSGARIITLGKRILRTETVALNILSIIMYELEN